MSGEWDPALLGCALAAGVAVACVVLRLMRWLPQRLAGPARSRAGLPAWLRAALPVAMQLAPLVEPLLPRGLARYLQAHLRAADLDDAMDGNEWLAVHLVTLSVASVTAALGGARAAALVLATLAGACWPTLWLRDCRARLTRGMDRDLPRVLELVTLAVEAGCSLGAALRIGVQSGGSGALPRGLAQSLRAIHAGRPRADALVELAARYGHAGLDAMVAAIVHADASGAGIAATLRAQVEQRTEERFARAERVAMESPVRMLGPLILCIFPCAFLVIGFPIAHRLLQWA
jgi:tight adherence protein C